MKLATFYTGSVRTLNKTLPYFLNNVLNASKNIQVHIYIVIDAKKEDRPAVESLLKSKLHSHLISLVWFDHSDPHYTITKQWNLQNIFLEGWRPYLNNSGSMLEYYQLLLAYQSMLKYEWQKNFQYDYIFRTRTDSVVNTKLDFSWLNLNIEDIKTRIEYIKTQNYTNTDTKYSNEDVFKLFMATIYNPKLFHKIDNTDLIVSLDKTKSLASKIDTYDYKLVKAIKTLDPTKIKDFVSNGRYILTIRKNLMYVCKRNDFHLIPMLGVMYALNHHLNDNYTYNAESQFEMMCQYSRLSVFDYGDHLDDSSLYQYEESKFFDGEKTENEPLGKVKARLYCLVRK